MTKSIIYFVLFIAFVNAVEIKIEITESSIKPVYKIIDNHSKKPVPLYSTPLKLQDTEGEYIYFKVSNKWGSFPNPIYLHHDHFENLKKNPENRNVRRKLKNAIYFLKLDSDYLEIEFFFKGKSFGVIYLDKIPKKNLKESESEQEGEEKTLSSQVLNTIEERITILENGPISDNIILTFISSGYLSTQREKFLNDVRILINELKILAPFRKYFNFFNFYGIFRPDNAEGCPELDKNKLQEENYLGLKFQANGGFWGNNNDGVILARKHVPQSDFIVMLNQVNRYAGYAALGGPFLVIARPITTFKQFEKLFSHEFAHALGTRDEYYSLTQTGSSNTDRNCYGNTTNLPWQKWVGFKNSIGTVGAFPGCEYYLGNFRPQQDCLMNSFNQTEFCAVCKELIILRLYSYKPKIINSICPPEPDNQGISIKLGEQIDFQLKTPILSNVSSTTLPLRVTWSQTFGTSNTIVAKDTLNYSFKPTSAGLYKIVAVVNDLAEGFVRAPFPPEMTRIITYTIDVGSTRKCLTKTCNGKKYCYYPMGLSVNVTPISNNSKTLWTPNERFYLLLSNKGRLSVYDSVLKVNKFQTKEGVVGNYNLVVRDCQLAVYSGQTMIWSTNTFKLGVEPCSTIFFNDGNIVLRDAKNNFLWQSAGVTDGTKINRSILFSPNSLFSPSGKIQMTLRTNGELVIVNYEKLINSFWTSFKGPDGKYSFQVSADCNLVTYSGPQIKWSTNLTGNRVYPCYMKLTDQGDLMLIDANGTVVWDSKGRAGSVLEVDDETLTYE